MVIIKGDKWKWASGKDDYAETLGNSIELIPPTSEDRQNLKLGDRVLLETYVFTIQDGVPLFNPVRNGDFRTLVAILPSPEPQRGLPELMKVRDMPVENQINCLRNTLNDLIKYVKSEKEAPMVGARKKHTMAEEEGLVYDLRQEVHLLRKQVKYLEKQLKEAKKCHGSMVK